MTSWRDNWRLYFVTLLLVLNVFVWYRVVTVWPTDELQVAVLDVGQGDSILIKAPGGNTVLIDGGPDTKVLTRLGEQLPVWHRRIDLIVLTHPHADHLDGLVEVLKRFEVGAVIESAAPYNTPAYPAWQELIKEKGVIDIQAHRGEVADLAPGVTLAVLAPFTDFSHTQLTNVHDSMVVTRLNYASTSIMLTGDMEAPLEQELIATRDNLHSDILKVGHHGSKTSTSPEFIVAVAPRLAVISVGAHNRYGHPKQTILDRLALAGVAMLRTDLNGSVILRSDGQSWAVKYNKD